ncbi:MAG: 50S ribosomal protein L13 [Candidatus Diapherotrites archaeon]|uniref:Large ribosomal subunit protein uL13 n=1 Tax=Candidatus Iainarchaeum sp. TaxID=3101447 RepID=A0A7J4IX42_9ARCH|nr:MAG: large subunit ribosomal protein L13 [archaeon GW2011_AR10]MBS3059712.1 50S ribosomal protein L13 [Candidatus Diapherotrites archaeon]HIH08357.1 50S ribosomal protein L13 [Candidatus Diapherotrites archaeon]
MTVIDGTDLVLGRMSSHIAKRLLNGEKIDLVNAERVVIIGREESATQKFRKRIELAQKGNPEKGPKYPRMPDKIVKLSIRGMLPFKKSRGRKAFENLKTHIGVPKELEKENMETVEEAKKDLERQYIRMAKLSRQLGARWH